MTSAEFKNTVENARNSEDQMILDYALYNLGTTYAAMEEGKSAANYFSAISEEAPDRLKFAAYYNAGVMAHKNGDFEKEFMPAEGSCEAVKFYRFYSFEDMKVLFRTLAHILKGGALFGEFLRSEFESENPTRSAPERICSVFARAFSDCKIVPKGKSSANKRVHMYLRWMVRRGSPVDLGLWNWYSPADLIIPLDTHVMQEARKFGMLKEGCSAGFKTAQALTEELKKIWPGDPCKGDFALFGLGVANNE